MWILIWTPDDEQPHDEAVAVIGDYDGHSNDRTRYFMSVAEASDISQLFTELRTRFPSDDIYVTTPVDWAPTAFARYPVAFVIEVKNDYNTNY